MRFQFCNNGILSILDLTSMGDSSKREQSNKIGRFDSGLKYALCILFKNNIDVKIKSGEYFYILDSTFKSVDNKSKELLVIKQYKVSNYEFCNSYTTGFSIELGYNWSLWMAIRELYSNMKDENGYFSIDSNLDTDYDTIIMLESNKLNEIYDNWNNYFLEQDCINTDFNDKILIYDNLAEDQLLRIYKQNILIYTSKDTKSRYVYNCSNAEIDERRVLSNYHEIVSDIGYFATQTSDIKIIESFVILNEITHKEYFEVENLGYSRYSFSQAWINYVNQNQPQNLIRNLYRELISLDFVKLESKIVKATRDWYSSSIEIVNTRVEPKTALELVNSICKNIGFEIKYKVQESIIKTYKAAASTFDKIIYIDSSFTTEDMWQFIKAHYVLDSSDMDKIYKDYYFLMKSKL